MVKKSFQQIKKNTSATGIQAYTLINILREALLHMHKIISPHYNLCMFVA